MAKFKNILFNTTNAYSINSEIIKNIIENLKPEYASIIVEGDVDFEIKDGYNPIIDLRDNKNVEIINRTPFMQKFVSDEVLNNCKPIDAELLNKMSKYETIIFSQLQRVSWDFRNFYVMYERYISILKFWNNFLDEKKIELFIANNAPHEGFDFIIYCLCKIKGIRTIFSYQSPITSQIYMLENIEDGCYGLKETILKYEKQYADVSADDIPLDDNLKSIVEKYFTKQDTTPFYMKKTKKSIKYFAGRIKYAVKKTFINLSKGVFIKNLKFKLKRNSKLYKPYKKVLKVYNKLAINDIKVNGEIENLSICHYTFNLNVHLILLVIDMRIKNL